MRRLRTILAGREIPCEIANRPPKGYSLVFRGNLWGAGKRGDRNPRIEACGRLSVLG